MAISKQNIGAWQDLDIGAWQDTSLTGSNTPSATPSETPSSSPSTEADYSRGSYASLPADNTDLETAYSDADYTAVSTKNDVRVSQQATSEYAIHQFKDYVGVENTCIVEWEGQTNELPSFATVTLQIYNKNTNEWDTIDSDNSSAADTDFILTATVADLTNYKDENSYISCRVYQLDM